LGVERVAADAGRADEDVEPLEAADGGVELRGVANVVAVRQVEDVNLRAVGAQPLGGRSTDPARAARDERDAALEVVVVAHGAFLYGHGMRYPLGTERRDEVRTPGGLSLDELDLHSVSRDELRATPATLRLQAEVAEEAGRRELGANLRRAAELAAVPEDVVLEIYTA